MQSQVEQDANGYRFSNSWFLEAEAGRKGRRYKRESTKQLWDRLLKPQAASINGVVETGLSEGRSTLWILENLKPKFWLGIDPWLPGRGERLKDSRARMANFWHNVRTFHEQTPEYADEKALPEHLPIDEAEDGGFGFFCGGCYCCLAVAKSQEFLRDPAKDFQRYDLAVIDGLHHGWAAMTDAVLCWPLLNANGLIIFDDVHRRWQHGKAHVHEAVNGFHMGFEGWLRRELETGRQTWLRKIRE